MAFIFKKKDTDTDKYNIVEQDDILGYLDEVISKRIEISINYKNKLYPCYFYSFTPDDKLIRIQNIQPLFNANKKEVICGFPLDKTWFTIKSQIIVSKEDLFITTPESIRYAERRESNRAVFSPREEVKVTVVESIGSGTGVFGLATNISEEGICLTIDKTMLLNNEKIISPHKDLYKPDADIMLIKINKIPGGRPFETSGKVNRVFKDGGKWKLAIKFGKLPAGAPSQIQRFVESRSSEFKVTKRSRKKRLEMEENRQQMPEPKNDKPHEIPKKPIVKTIPPKIEKNKKEEVNLPTITVVTLGEELNTHLGFLSSIKSIKWVHGENQIQILALIHEVNADVLLLPFMLGDCDMLDYLQKIQSMGLIEDIEIAIFSENPISIKDRIRGKVANVETFFPLPITDKVQFINFLQKTKKNDNQ